MKSNIYTIVNKTVDFTVQTTHDLFDNGFSDCLIPLFVIINSVDIVNCSVQPTISVGTNSANYNNIVNSKQLSVTEMDTNNSLLFENSFNCISFESFLKMNIETPATADVYLAKIIIIAVKGN